ncbi:MAG: aminopeptidase P family protein [Burkholderiales bacterium]
MNETTFQSYVDRGNRAAAAMHFSRLRTYLAATGLDGFVVPHEDEWANEYVPLAYDRLAWLTGYTGTFGYAIILMDVAKLFVDGRYRIQAAEQTDPSFIDIGDAYADDASRWLGAHARPHMRIGYDPHLHTLDGVTKLASIVKAANAHLFPLECNPVDAIWVERPSTRRTKVRAHAIRYAGESSSSKRQRLGAEIEAQGADAAVITSPHSVAWLFNIRGNDVRHSPLPLAEAVLRSDGSAELFLQTDTVDDALRSWLEPQVQILPSEAFEDALRRLANQSALVDPQSTSAFVFDRLAQYGAHIIRGADPVVLPRAVKNATEIEGARVAHRLDGLALTKLLHWLADNSQQASLDEITICRRLETFRRDSPELQDLSCGAIAGAGPHGALPHYRVSTCTNRVLDQNSLFLIDSGGQYFEGTTDVTRTVAIGEPSAEMRRRYTDVLKGHLRISAVRFPEGLCGHHLDALARLDLWSAGLDFDHGTGHGVGSYLPIHEGPHGITTRRITAPLRPGMLVTNEPGYYKEGYFGIRIENVMLVTEPMPIQGGDRPMLAFETLTLVPYCRELIDLGRLTCEERQQINLYHARVWATHERELAKDARAWLERAVSPL